jgi:hypothetical protein
VELTLRITTSIPLLDYHNPNIIFGASERVFGLRPNFAGRFTGVDVRTNSFGFRDDEIYMKRPNEFRIMGLGDSVFFGYKVESGKDTLSVLEENLKTKFGNVSVINLAIPAYALPHEIETYKSFKKTVSADIVILGFVLNDIKRVDPLELTRSSMSESLREKPFWQELLTIIRGNSVIWALFEDRLPNILFSIGYSKPFPVEKAGDIDEDSLALVHEQIEQNQEYKEKYEEAWESIEKNVSDFKRLTQNDGVEVIFVIFPWREQISRDCWAAYGRHLLWKDIPLNDYALGAMPQKRLSAILDKYGIAYIDLLESFRNNSDKECALMLDRNHPSPKGHRLAADVIFNFLQARKLIH